MKVKLLSICLIILAYNSFSQDTDSIKGQVDDLRYTIEIMKRDQTNYIIEKELLKEIYTSNLQTVNIIITIVLGVFSMIGFMGIRSISAINKEYQSELKKFISIREQIENQIKETIKEQEKLTKKYNEIDRTNEEQTKKIKILEIQEKANVYLSHNNYQLALNYLNIAYELDSKNTSILRQKAYCLWKLNKLNLAIENYEDLLKNEPTDNDSKINILELYLISEQTKKYDEKYDEYKNVLDEREEQFELKLYFKIFRDYIDNANINEEIEKYYTTVQGDEKRKRINWDFDDVLKYLKKKQESDNTINFKNFIYFLNGKKTKLECLESLKKV